MAGGLIQAKPDPKKPNLFQAGFNNEVLKDSAVSKTPAKFSLRGILGLNKPVEISSVPKEPSLWTKENFGISYLAQQEKALLDQKQKELEKSIKELQEELKILVKTTEGVDSQLEKAVFENIPETSEYQISFLVRFKNLIINLRKNISEASCWLESFNQKKKKKNYFWSMARNKKQGGEQYLNSGEHSVARSAN